MFRYFAKHSKWRLWRGRQRMHGSRNLILWLYVAVSTTSLRSFTFASQSLPAFAKHTNMQRSSIHMWRVSMNTLRSAFVQPALRARLGSVPVQVRALTSTRRLPSMRNRELHRGFASLHAQSGAHPSEAPTLASESQVSVIAIN